MFRASKTILRLAPRVAVSKPSPYHPLARIQHAQPSQNLSPILQIARFATKRDDPPPPPIDETDHEREKKVAQEVLKSDPKHVSAESSVRSVFEPSALVPPKDDVALSGGLKHDIDIVKDTFRLSDVPRESHILGLAGTIPYVGTSLSTIFLAWDLNQTWPTGNSFYDTILIDHETAKYLLSVIEPLQLGYGAVIISFLGAIHWGLEYAEKKPLRERTRFRYGIGLAASVIAWPTLLMPIEYALTTQFMAFVALYFVDSRAATRGWAPSWYGTYRFLLTAMVGLAIFVSLVGRTKINQSSKLTEDSMTKSGLADHTTDWAKLEQEEKERIRKAKKEAERKAAAKANKEKQQKVIKEKGGDMAKFTPKGDEGGEENESDKEKAGDEEGKESKEEDKEGEKEGEKEEGRDKEDSQDEKNKNDSQDDKSDEKDDTKEKK